MIFSFELMNEPHVSRKSAGIFGYLNFFQSTGFVILLLIGMPIGIGLVGMLFDWGIRHTLNFSYFTQDGLMFFTISILGTIGCLFFRDRTPLFSPKLAYSY